MENCLGEASLASSLGGHCGVSYSDGLDRVAVLAVQRPGIHLHVRSAITRVVPHLLIDHLSQTLTRGLVAHVVSRIPGPRDVRLRSVYLGGNWSKATGPSSWWWRGWPRTERRANSGRGRRWLERHLGEVCCNPTRSSSNETTEESSWESTCSASLCTLCGCSHCSKEGGDTAVDHVQGRL